LRTITAARHRQLLAALLLGGILVIAPTASAGVSPTRGTCHRYVAPNGSDRGPGTAFRPFRSVQRLVDSLQPGQTGCLLPGLYVGSVRIGHGGRPGARVILRSFPGSTARIAGRLAIMRGANYVTVTGLDLNGENPTRLPSPTIDADHVTFSYDDVTNDHTGICFAIGSASWGWATGTLITHDRVHGCGQQVSGDNYQHGFYIGAATDTTIEWSLIYGNAARGIQLYPDAQYTTIAHNIIDDNGEGIMISGEGGVASSHTNIFDNIISDSVVRHDVESWWPAGNPIGTDNLVHDNCLWRGREGTIDGAMGGLKAWDNARLNPQFVDAAAYDYRLKPSSPCLFAVGDVEAAVDRTAATIPLVEKSPFATGSAASRTRHRHKRDGR